jgi:hypothetical protein
VGKTVFLNLYFKNETNATCSKALKDQIDSRYFFLVGVWKECEIVYRFENLRAFKGLNKVSLPVVWHSNWKAWVTIFFSGYITSYLSPFISKYCAQSNLG